MLCQGKTVIHIFEQLPYRPIGVMQTRNATASEANAMRSLTSKVRAEDRLRGQGRGERFKAPVPRLQYFQYLSRAFDSPPPVQDGFGTLQRLLVNTGVRSLFFGRTAALDGIAP